MLGVEVLTGAAYEYERNHGMQNLQSFFDSSLPLLSHPEVKGWGDDLTRERSETQEAATAQLASERT